MGRVSVLKFKRSRGEAKRLEECMWAGEDITCPESVDPEIGCKALVR